MPAGVETGAGATDGGVEVDGAGVEAGGAKEEGPSNPRARALRLPGNVIKGSSRFQQFFLIYAKLMARLRDSKVRESDMTPLATHKAVMRAGKPSREELD